MREQVNEVRRRPRLAHSASMAAEVKYYHHGRFAVEGGTIPDAVTAYQTFGDPKNPCIVFPTCYGGRLDGESSRLYHRTP